MPSIQMACHEGVNAFTAWKRRYPVQSAEHRLIGSPEIKDINHGLELLVERLQEARATHIVPIAGIWLSLPEFSADIDKMYRDGTWIEMGDPPASIAENRLVTLLNGKVGAMTTVYAGILTVSHSDSGYEETLVCFLLREQCGAAIFPTK